MDFSKLGQAAIESEDLTKDAVYKRELPKAGPAFLRLREYLELGRHKPKNPQHKPALKAVLIFELSHPNHLIEMDGKKVPQQFRVRINKGSTAKAGYKKLFNVMNLACGGGNQHFIQMIDKPLMGTIYHKDSGEGAEKQTYANLDLDGAWSIVEPVQHDFVNGTTTTVPIPELNGTPKVFLWENKTVSDEDIVEMWNSIHIEGTREVPDKVSGGTKEMSKNWVQESIMENLEWEGSTTQALTQEHVTLDDYETGSDNALAGAASAGAGGVPSLDD